MTAWRARLSLLLALLAAAACTAAPTSEVPRIAPGERPPIESDEAGIWMAMERAEERARTSGRVVRDPALQAYVTDLLCRLSPDYCGELRLYIVRQPGFNASMAPNGAMYLWTGMLLRAENEAQLAFVLGHEFAHYRERHSLRRWRDLRAKADVMPVFNIALALAGLGAARPLATLAVLGTVAAFSRDQEREADQQGYEALAAAGFAPAEAPRIWAALNAERAASRAPERAVFFATHPSGTERQQTLSALAEAYNGGHGAAEQESYLAVTAPYFAQWLEDELRVRDYEATLVLIERLAKTARPQGPLHYARGEVHRLRGEEGDAEKAVAAYRAALDSRQAPAEAARELGLVLWSRNEPKAARAAFRDYLARRPQADDRAMIESYLEELNPS